MATEIVTLKVNDSFTPEQCEKSIEFMRTPRPPPGLQVLRWGHTVEDPNTIMWILNWDSVEAHKDFMNAPIYPSFVATIKAFCIEPIKMYHTHLQPFPPVKVFEAAVIEIAAIAKKPDVPHEQFATVISQILDVVVQAPGYHSHFNGIKYEDSDTYIMVIGWDSVESHRAASDSEAMREVRAVATSLHVREKMSVFHLKLQPQ